MTVTDIKESDIRTYCGYGSSESGKFILYKKSGIKIEVNDNQTPEELKQQILQNQKDAQEYKKIKDESLILNPNLLEEIENYKRFNNEVKPHKFLREGKEDDCQECGFPERFHQKKLTKLQSQHKKLVDALQATRELCPDSDLSKLIETLDNRCLGLTGDSYLPKSQRNEFEAIVWTLQQFQNLLKESEKE